MEVGAVKHSFQNEIIHLKKNLNQARTQIIHKLSRKAQLFKKKENIPEKLKRKADNFVAEILILKKITAKQLVKFAVGHHGDLNSFLNKPHPDFDRVAARILLHKCMQKKYKFLRERFSNMPIDQLLLTRRERLQMKKEQKNKAIKKNTTKITNESKVSEWTVEDIIPAELESELKSIIKRSSKPDNKIDGATNLLDMINKKDNSEEKSLNISAKKTKKELLENNYTKRTSEESNKETGVEESQKGVTITTNPMKHKVTGSSKNKTSELAKSNKVATTKRNNKNLKNKTLVQKTDSISTGGLPNSNTDNSHDSTKLIDSFFTTSTGENYLTLAEPRKADDFKEEHNQGNRKMRRAVMFGRSHMVNNRRPPPYRKPEVPYENKNDRKNSFKPNDGTKSVKNKFEDFKDESVTKNYTKMDESNKSNKFTDIPKTEKLHPSWEAKKQKSGILAFQGKKVVFD